MLTTGLFIIFVLGAGISRDLGYDNTAVGFLFSACVMLGTLIISYLNLGTKFIDIYNERNFK